MKTYLSEVINNGNASRFFWALALAVVLGGATWLSALYAQVQTLQLDTKITQVQTEQTKLDIKEIKEDIKEIKRLVVQFAGRK